MSTGRRRLGGSFFFFSIRRRHTRLVSDWSSDVCSSDLSPTLMSTRLAIIFGMMRVINLAHGEFLMLGGYAAIVATNHGVNIWVAMLAVAPLVVGIIGVIAARLIIRALFGRMIDTLLVTSVLSLFLIRIC